MRDMTQGSPLDHLWHYAVPLVLANWLQLAYNTTDSILAGRFIGRSALAAEGIAGPVMNLVILAITGLCIGAGVLMSEFFGARQMDLMRETLATTLLVGLFLSIAVMCAGILFTPWLLSLYQVPEEIVPMSAAYLRITFLGVPFTFTYNALAAELKSAGDSKTPLLFLGCSSILNIVLDLFFLGLLHFGIICSALTTVAAEVFSAGMALMYLAKHSPQMLPGRSDWRIRKKLLLRMLRYAGPTALQQTVQPVGKVLIQGAVNTLGMDAIAAFFAAGKLDDFAMIPAQNISAAISPSRAQKRGAGKNHRLREGFSIGMKLEIAYGISIGLTTLLFRRPILSIFISGDGADEVVREGSKYLFFMAFFYLFPALTNGVQGFFRGMGKMMTTIFATFVQISIRTLCSYLLIPRIGIVGIALASAIGWSVMLLFEVPYYIITIRKQESGQCDMKT